MGLFRLRGRLDAMQSDAQRTMAEARETMEKAQVSLETLTKLVTALIEETLDGVNISLVRTGDNKDLIEFLAGHRERLPFRIEIDPEEEEDKNK